MEEAFVQVLRGKKKKGNFNVYIFIPADDHVTWPKAPEQLHGRWSKIFLSICARQLGVLYSKTRLYYLLIILLSSNWINTTQGIKFYCSHLRKSGQFSRLKSHLKKNTDRVPGLNLENRVFCCIVLYILWRVVHVKYKSRLILKHPQSCVGV